LTSPSNDQPLVSFVVGKDNPRTFTVHKDFATFRSPVFDAAFNGHFLESNTKTMNLDDVDPDVFAMLVQWLYTEETQITIKDDTTDVMMLANLWTLGDRFQMRALQNTTLLHLDRYVSDILFIEHPTLYKDLAHYVYTKFSETELEKCPLKQLVVDRVGQGDPESLEEHKGNFPQQIWFDLAVTWARRNWDSEDCNLLFTPSRQEYMIRDPLCDSDEEHAR
jgi:hypothetical protein